MPYEHKKSAYRTASVAAGYEERRFAGALGRQKHARDVALVRQLLALPAGARVLDVPTGTGRLVHGLVAAGHSVLAADVSAEMLEGVPKSRRSGRVQADAEHLPLADASVDAVLCWRFFFHVDDPAARHRILAELARVSRGRVVIQERDANAVKRRLRGWRAPQRLRPAPSLADLKHELEEAGLDLEQVAPVSRFFSDKLALVARPVR